MAYQKRYRAIVPVPHNQPDQDDLVLVWLTRESFERAADRDCLHLTEFSDLGELDPAEIPPKAEEQLEAPATDYAWRIFEGTGERRTETDA